MKRIEAVAKLLIVGTVIIAIGGITGAAWADEVTFTGYTNGCFGLACSPPNTSAPQSAILLGLTYNNSTFSGTTSNGFLGIGNNATPPGNVNNLGSFSLAPSANVYNGNSFTLRWTFTAPPGIAPPGAESQLYSALLTGSVTTVDQGGVFFDFDNAPRTFSFTSPAGPGLVTTGSFTASVNDVTVQAGHIVPVTGTITAAQQTTRPPSEIPEPTTLLLIGTGLIAMTVRMRRRRS
jgi:hypothetical protein